MLNRFYSLLLIVAIIACPMRCSNGVCHSHQCCAADDCEKQAQPTASCAQHESTDCCGGNCSQENAPDAPPHSPDESSCQGVCSGAVFEKSCELNGTDGTFFFPQTTTHDTSIVSAYANVHGTRAEQIDCQTATNPGRGVRILQMSFSC